MTMTHRLVAVPRGVVGFDDACSHGHLVAFLEYVRAEAATGELGASLTEVLVLRGFLTGVDAPADARASAGDVDAHADRASN